MYQPSNRDPLGMFKFLKDHNVSKLSFFEHCYSIGLISCPEYMSLRQRALQSKLNG